VDDLEKGTAFRMYEEFGFEDKELVWEYIGGKEETGISDRRASGNKEGDKCNWTACA
jgi:hypothetical protein